MIKVNNDNFNEVVSEGTVLIEFYADWCGPCKAMDLVLKKIDADTDVTVGKVNVDTSPGIASAYMVVAIPTMVLFKNGNEVDRMFGAKSYSAIVDKFRLGQDDGVLDN